MRKHSILKIGEFAQIAQVSIPTLRHYDHYGLLKPSSLDPETGYRYYSLDQLPRLHRIIALKELGFSLEQIARLLEENLSLEHLQGMFLLKQAHIEQLIVIEQARLARIASRLRYIEQEGRMPAYEIVLKQVNPLLVATLRETMALTVDLEQKYRNIFTYLDQQRIAYEQLPLLLRHSRYETRDDGIYADIELAVPLRTSLPDHELLKCRTLPGGVMACTVHTGNAHMLGQVYMALHSWMADNGYRFAGPPRQLHLQSVEYSIGGHAVTEVQFPVEKQDG